MKIAFIYIAEPYQCYHTASVASKLAAMPNCEVTEYYSFPETMEHLVRIRAALNEPNLEAHPLKKSWKAKFLKLAKRLDQERILVLRENVQALNCYDAIVATEYTAGILKKMGLKAKLILMMHGAGDRYVNDEHLVKEFDLTLISGKKTKEDFKRKGFIKDETTRVVGYPKFDVFEAIRKKQAHPFSDDCSFALYNPHYKRNLNSSPVFMNALIKGLTEQHKYNLVVAPHIKQFYKSFGIKKYRLKRLQSAKVLIDTGSPAMLDMTYTSQTSLYIGDVSSQIYEFLAIPRPCIFLNPQKIKWQDDPHFLHWTMGDVVEDIDDLMPAVEQAIERHALYRPTQEKLFKETFGYPLLGASQRAADAIMDFVAKSMASR